MVLRAIAFVMVSMAVDLQTGGYHVISTPVISPSAMFCNREVQTFIWNGGRILFIKYVTSPGCP